MHMRSALHLLHWMRCLPVILSIVALLCAHSSVAQLDTLTTGFISGVVTDRSTGERMPFSVVFIRELGRHVVTSEDGYYAFAHVPPGHYTITVEWVGYEPYAIDQVKVRTGHITHVDMALRFAVLPRHPKNVRIPDQ